MKKRLFKSVPIPEVDTQSIRNTAMERKNITGVIVSQKRKIDSQDTLILNLYQVSGCNKRDISLSFRIFCQKNDYITYDVENDKWKTGSLLCLTCNGWTEYWWSYNHLEFASSDEAATAEKMFCKWNKNCKSIKDGTVFKLLDIYQNDIKKARLSKKHKKITDVIDAEMEKFGELPKDYQNFIENRVFAEDNYIFYNSKKKMAYCTSCKNTFMLENKLLKHKTIPIWNNRDTVAHNSTVRCPYCNKFLYAKSEGMSRKKLISVQWSMLVQKNKDEVITRYFLHTKDFTKDFKNPQILTCEKYRTVHSAEKTVDYMWDKFALTDKIRWCYYRDKMTPWGTPSKKAYPQTIFRYNTSLQEIVEGTWLKYSVPDVFINEVVSNSSAFNKVWAVDNYFCLYRKYPFIEQLLKVGFYKITEEFLTGSGSFNKLELKIGCNSILDTLGVNKCQFNMLRKLGNPRLQDLAMLKYAPDLKWDEFLELHYVRDNGYAELYKKFIDCRKYTTIYKIRKYINKQGITYENDYFDYIHWLEEMKYDMKNEFNLFPKCFYKAHHITSKLYVKFIDEQVRIDIQNFNCLLNKLQKENIDAMNLEIEDLFIRLPNRLEEIKEEGEALHHCVGTYMEKVQKGITMIFFIRKRSEPDKPYFTLEWHGRVIQCRGLHNCNMPPNVEAFVSVFEKKMLQSIENRKKAG